MNTGCSKAGRKSFFFHYSILSMGVRLHGLFFFFTLLSWIRYSSGARF